jgi:hypothetical protein
MDVMTAATMESLVRQEDGPCVSAYLPTHRFGPETAQGPIVLKNLLQQARRELVATGLRGSMADDLLEGAVRLTGASEFWQHQDDGLAVFVAPGRTERFRLPVSVPELVVVADAFHVKPLWPVVSGDEVFYLLALSRNEVRLLRADRFRVGEVDLPETVPTSLAEALWFDDPEKQLQYHAAGRVGQGRPTALFHGHGSPDERDEAKLAAFLRAVDRGLRHLIDPAAPLVLAGVEEVVAVFRKVSDHQGVADDAIVGNPDEMKPDELHRRAVPIMADELRRTVEADAARFRGGGALALSEVPTVVSSALAGRVDTIFLPIGTQVWGQATEGGEIVVHGDRGPGDRDLLDLAAVTTWSAGGQVRAVGPEDVPGDGPVAALLRY